MDVEKTIQFLLDNQARAEARSEKFNEKFERQLAASDKRLTRIEGIVKQGMELVRHLAKRQVETDQKLKILISSHMDLEESHRRREESHRRLEEAMRRYFERRNGNGSNGKNGHGKKK